MPKTPTDYSKAIIYSIICKTDDTLLYIGSTTNLTKRKAQHKENCNKETYKKHNLQVYVMIRENGGWDNFNMKPVKEYPCSNKIQLVIEEERIRKEMNATLNTLKAHTTKEEYKKAQYESYKKRRELHKEELKEYERKRYETNKESKLEYSREKARTRYEAKKEEILKKRQEKYKVNKEEINKQRREKLKLKNPLVDTPSVE
jgi:predicted GIY-YIG superfamily endonuclease